MAQRSRVASAARSSPLPAGAHFTNRRPLPVPTANVTPPSSLTQTGVRGAPPARARTGGGTLTSGDGAATGDDPACRGGPSGAGLAAGSGMGGFQAEAALLDDQAAVLDVEQPGVLGD